MWVLMKENNPHIRRDFPPSRDRKTAKSRFVVSIVKYVDSLRQCKARVDLWLITACYIVTPALNEGDMLKRLSGRVADGITGL